MYTSYEHHVSKLCWIWRFNSTGFRNVSFLTLLKSSHVIRNLWRHLYHYNQHCAWWLQKSNYSWSISVQWWVSSCPVYIWGRYLTHWGRDKMAGISQTTLSNSFSWMKMLEFRFKLHWSLLFCLCPINNIPALAQVMAWRRPGYKPLSEPMMVRLRTHICVTRPQWVESLLPTCHQHFF